MLIAAPGDFLDFSSVIKKERIKNTQPLKWNGLSVRKKKKFGLAVKVLRDKIAEKKDVISNEYVPSPIAGAYDDVYDQGMDWIDSLAGEPVFPGEYEAEFSKDIWYSKTREGDFKD